MPRRATTPLAAALAALTLSACAGGSSASPTPYQGPDPGVAHVHGLGVDPADGMLYAATHYGLFRLPERGEATRVAGRMQDTMGFTVTGPRTFLGSGHPDSAKDPQLPPRLGLVKSTDAAQSWQVVSLGGEADFHALHAAHGRIHGWDAGSGRLLVSADDGRTWETRSTLALRDFAVRPRSADELLATTQRGVARSTDGGRTWTGVSGAPALAVLAWPRADALYGVTPNGSVRHSDDGGRSWTERGSAGAAPEALTVDDRGGTQTLYLAVRDRGVLASRDGGRTFSTRYAEQPAAQRRAG